MAISSVTGASVLTNYAITAKTKVTEDSFVPFEDLLKNAVGSVNETDSVVKMDQVNLASGKTDDLHTITIDAAKADLALQTLVQVRNKALDAYNEIMKMTL